MAKKLYEIEQQIENAYYSSLDPETGEIVSVEALNALKELQVEKEEKLKSIRWIYKKMESENEACKLEKERINMVQKCLKHNMEKLKEFILATIEHESNKVVGINFRKGVKSVELSYDFEMPEDEVVNMGFYTKKITYTPNKDAIKEALEKGEEVKGAKLVVRDSVSFGKATPMITTTGGGDG